MPVEPIPCAAPEPEPPTPACCSPGIASTGLCLGDGTPISVLAVAACTECGADAAAPEVVGWLDLTTGAFTAGPPPAGAEACAGQPQQFQVGQWCDLDSDGEVIAPVLVEYEYDDTGALVGVRTLTPGGDPYTVSGTLGICPGPVDDVEYLVLCDVQDDGTTTQFLRALTPNGDDTSTARDTTLDGSAPYAPTGTVGLCAPEHVLGPVQFCFSSTDTVERPGRLYDIDLPIAQGFGLEAVLVDLVEYPAPVVWGVSDVDGSQFAADLQAVTQARFPGATVTVTPPAITATCGAPETFHVRIECLDLEEPPPALVQYRYNAGQDLISNPSFATTPPTPNASAQLRRTTAGGTLNCTDTANRGWETNDVRESFEYWGYANTPPGLSPINTSKATTPTPRGTPILEINAFGSAGGGPSTIWQTFQVDTAGTFNIRVVIGARTAPVEPVAIKLSTGDVDAAGTGDIISTVVNAPRVTNEGGGTPGPWTTYTNTVQLNPGLYTLAFTGPPNPPSPTATGGLFTDMRVYQDIPGRLANFATDDDACTVSVDVTSTTCEFWAPIVNGGEITQWQRLTDSLVLDNAAFWTQVPAPSCCSSDTSDAGTGTVGNLADSYPVCAVVGGETLTVQRVVITDQNGGILTEQFIGADGSAVTPQSWTPGACPGAECLDCATQVLCDTDPNPPSTIVGMAASGTLPNGVAWTSTGTTALPPNKEADGAAWWGSALFPNPSIPTNLWTFDRAVNVEFSVLMNWSPAVGDTQNQVQLPEGAVPVSLPPGYTYDPATHTLHADSTLTACTLNSPTRAAGARFRVTGVTSLALRYLGTRAVNTDCRMLGHWLFGALDVSLGGEFQRTTCRDCTGAVVSATDTTLDGAPYTPVGIVGVCQPPEPCPSTVEVLRLCDLNPNVDPGEDGRRCAVPFLRHLVHDCTGALVETRDTAVDGTTPYTPVKVVDCTTGVPALSELLWPQTGIVEDPAGVARQDYVYTITNPETEETAEVRLHASSTSPGGCGVYDPANPVFNNPTTYTLTLDAAAQEMSVFRLDLLDFDTFEGVTGLSPIPSRVEGDVTWSGSTITANSSNGTAYVYWDQVPPVISYRYGNTGGGLACSSVAFQGMTLVPDGCCGCDAAEPCRDSTSTLLCDTSATDLITVFDPANRASADGWEVVSFTGFRADAPPEAPLPYPARYSTVHGYPALGARTDQNAGYGGGNWAGYDSAPVRWVLRKTFTAPEDGVAIAQSVAFRGDGGARVRINGLDAGMYGQWNRPATSGTAQIPVTAGANVVEIEVRDVGGINNVVGRLDIALPKTIQFMRRQVTDCATGEVVSTHDTTLDGEPYTVTGEVGQCEPVAECCEQPPPETRLDVETHLLCLRDTASGEVLGQVLVERVYDDQTGDLTEQRVTDPTTAAPVEIPAGAELARCPSPDRITRQICVAASGRAEFLTNVANATSGVDSDWTWSPSAAGPWHPMYRVAPNPAWTAADGAPNAAHWVAPHMDRTVCPTAGETSPMLPGTWYTRASWMLPADVDPTTIRIAASILNADNKVVQWRLNDGPWQPVAGGTLGGPPWTFPPTAVPGGRAGQNEVVVQLQETNPPVSCPNPNQAGMILHVAATYDHEPRSWTQVLEDGRVYYLDETGARQDALLPGDRIVPCAGGGEGSCCPPEPRVDVESEVLCIRTADGEITDQVLVERVYDDQTGDRTAQHLIDPTTGEEVTLPDGASLVLCQEPACPVAFSTECVGVVTRTEASYDNTSLIGGEPGQCGSVQGPGGQFPCQPTGPLTITSWIVDGEEVIGEGGGRDFNGGPCGPGTPTAPGMHLNWSQALTNLDPSGATWVVKSEPACAFFVGSVGGTRTVYGAMTVRDAAGQQWILGPAQGCEEVQYTKVFTQECDGTVSVSWLDADGVETAAPEGDRVPCGTGCSGSGGSRGPDVELVALCDEAADGTTMPFLRHIAYDSAGQVSVVVDTALDGVTPYSPAGAVGVCQPEQDGQDVELLPMCVIDNVSGNVVERVLAEVRYDAETGERTGVNYVDPQTWGPVAVPGGTHFGLCPEAPEPDPQPEVEVLSLCDAAPGGTTTPFLRHLVYQPGAAAPLVLDTLLDGTTPYAVAGEVGTCEPAPEPCRTTSTVELCDIAVTETVTVFDPTTVMGSDGWQVTRFDGAQPGYGPEQPVPYDAYQRINAAGLGQLSSRSDFTMGPTSGPVYGAWPGYDAAPIVWVLSKTFTLAVGGTAKVRVENFKGDHAARVRVNGIDLGLFSQYNAPVEDGTFEVPVSAGANTIEIEDHDVSRVSYVSGRITVTVAGQTAFLRHFVLDCDTGEVIATTDTTLAGDPYTVAGEVGQCTVPVEGEPGEGGGGAPCLATSVIEQCRWDDTDGDGIGDTSYVELMGVGCDGAVSPLGTYTDDLSEPYTPLAPVPEGPVEGAPPARGVRAHRIVLAPGESWDAGTVPLLQAVTVVAHGTGQVTTEEGTSDLAAGESIGWSVARDSDAALTGPLVVSAVDGPVAVAWTRSVAL